MFSVSPWVQLAVTELGGEEDGEGGGGGGGGGRRSNRLPV